MCHYEINYNALRQLEIVRFGLFNLKLELDIQLLLIKTPKQRRHNEIRRFYYILSVSLNWKR